MQPVGDNAGQESMEAYWLRTLGEIPTTSSAGDAPNLKVEKHAVSGRIIRGKYFTSIDISVFQDETGNVYAMKGRVKTGSFIDETFRSADLIYKKDTFLPTT